ELAVRDGTPFNLANVHVLQMMVRHWRGDLAGVERHFTSGISVFADPSVRLSPIVPLAFGVPAINAYIIGRVELALARIEQLMAAKDESNAFHGGFLMGIGGMLYVQMREYEKAEPLLNQAGELSEKNQLPQVAAYFSGHLGRA